MDFVLAHHHRLGAETLDDRAHERADLRAGQHHRHFIFAARFVKGFAHLLDELLELRRRHGELAFLALADDRLRKGLFPGGRQRDEWQVTGRRQVGMAKLTGEARAHVR